MARKKLRLNKLGQEISEDWIKRHPNEPVFDSKLEVSFYNRAIKNGLSIIRNTESFVLQESFSIKALSNSSKNLVINSTVRKISYTPDFVIKVGSFNIYIETKGFFDESDRLRYKMFQYRIDTKKEMVFIVFNEKHMGRLFTYIKNNFLWEPQTVNYGMSTSLKNLI